MLAAFAVSAEPEPLAGGSGLAWRAGNAVLKPLDRSPAQLEWEAGVLARTPRDAFRLAPPLAAADGRLVVEGWTAWPWLAGTYERRWDELIAVGERFLGALAGLPKPAFLSARTDPWFVGEQVALGVRTAEEFADVPHVLRLAAFRGPLDDPLQVIHGDLAGNVLFADGLPPAIIDVSPVWAPAGFAYGIMITDALVWQGADESVLETVRHVPNFPQYLIRGLLFRLVVHSLFPSHEWAPFEGPVELACRLAV